MPRTQNQDMARVLLLMPLAYKLRVESMANERGFTAASLYRHAIKRWLAAPEFPVQGAGADSGVIYRHRPPRRPTKGLRLKRKRGKG